MKIKSKSDLKRLILDTLAEKKMTVADLADRLEIRRNTIDRALSGDQDITIGRLLRWTRALGANLEVSINPR